MADSMSGEDMKYLSVTFPAALALLIRHAFLDFSLSSIHPKRGIFSSWSGGREGDGRVTL